MAFTSFGILYAILMSSILMEVYSFAPVNLAIHTLNFNLTLTWEPPEVEPLGNEHFLYTVERTSGGSSKGNVPQCVCISETFCSLLPVFPQGRGFRFREFFKVTSFSNIDISRRGSDKTTFSGSNIEVSAPFVYNATITDRHITLWIRGPETPFEKNGRKLIMIEENVGDELALRDLQFNASLFESSDPTYIGRPWISGHVIDGRHRLEYNNLDPNTAYVILMQSRYGRRLSSDITTFEFRTAQSEAPDVHVSTTAASTQFTSVPITSGFEDVTQLVKGQRVETGEAKAHVSVMDDEDSESKETTVLQVKRHKMIKLEVLELIRHFTLGRKAIPRKI